MHFQELGDIHLYSHLNSETEANGNIVNIYIFSAIALFILLIAFIVKKKPGNQTEFFSKALLIVAVLYLISPTQFPWYYSWMVPLLAIRPMVSLLIYPLLLPLYQIKYLSETIIYIQHLPVIFLLILELRGNIWKDKFSFQDKEYLETN